MKFENRPAIYVNVLYRVDPAPDAPGAFLFGNTICFN